MGTSASNQQEAHGKRLWEIDKCFVVSLLRSSERGERERERERKRVSTLQS